jgi:hypothetical protein
MPKQLIEFRLENGETIIAEVEEPTSDAIAPIARTPGDIAAKAKETLEGALKKVIKPFAVGSSTIVSELRNINEPADEIEVKFGVKLSGTIGAVLTAGGEASYEVTLKWNSKKS